jgi:16S rRNA (cytidine1402-2'-O)-methyltransferase
MSGTLYLVATPIGNLEDVTLRALRVLREADVVAAEDTRRTAGLLAHFEIRTPLESLHEHNEASRLPSLLGRLESGQRIALVSDAGTPLVSDPGAALVRAAIDAGVHVEVVPGPSALLAALVASGLPAGTFTFLGFAPSRDEERRRWLRAAGAEPRTVVFFDAPHRIRETLAAALAVLGDRHVAVGRELTKLHEEFLRGRLSEVVPRVAGARGELTVVLAPAPDADVTPPALSDAGAWDAFADLTGRGGTTRRDAVAVLARRYSLPAREIYAAIERGKAAATSSGHGEASTSAVGGTGAGRGSP